MNLTEQLLSRREIYHGRIIDVQVDTVSLPNGNTSTREVVRHPGGVGILALDDAGWWSSTAMCLAGRCWRSPPESGSPARTR